MLKKKKTSVLTDAFLGRYVFILTDVLAKRSVRNDEYEETVEQPIKLLGYLLDMDEEFFYVGESTQTITQAVARKSVKHIETATVKDEWDELLDNLPSSLTTTKVN